MLLNPALVGRRYPATRFTVTVEGLRAFAMATDDDNPRYPAVAPPLYALVVATPSERRPLMDPELVADRAELLRRLVRGENDLTWHLPIHPGDVVECTAQVLAVEPKGGGELLRVGIDVARAGELVARVEAAYFVRGVQPVDQPRKADGVRSAASPTPAGALVATTITTVTADQPRRYAEPSDDKNPIHLDRELARRAGFDDVILQGSCTMAFAARAVVDSVLGGDPSRLARLQVRYARPVLPGNRLTTTLRRDGGVPDGPEQLHLTMTNQRGDVVLAPAFAVVRG